MPLLEPPSNPGCVYLLTAPSGKQYVGITTQPIEKRWEGHQKKSSNCILVKRAIEKYGWDKINKEILLYCQKDQLGDFEKTFIALYNSLAPNGMNCTSGGEIKKKLSNNTKRNISEGVKKFFIENPHKHPKHVTKTFTDMTLADKKKAKGSVSKFKQYYRAKIPMSWNNGKPKQLYFKTRELAQAAIEEWRSKLIQ